MQSEKQLKKQAIILASLAVVLILVLGYSFIAATSRGLHEEKVRYLEEISLKSASNVKKQIEGYFSTVEAIATMVGSRNYFSADETLEVLKTEADKRYFKRMGLILPNGTAYTTDGHISYFGDREYFKQAMKGQRSASDSLADKVDGEEISVMAAPIFHKGYTVGVIFATQTQQQITEALSIESFGGEGYSYIITSDGRPVVKTSHPDSIGDYTNLYETLAQRGLEPHKLESLRAGIQAGETGSLESTRDGSLRHLYYAPVGINDWYILSVIPSSVISQQSDRLIRNLGFLVVLMVALAIIICSNMILFFRRNNRQLTHIAYTDIVTGYTNWVKFQLDAEAILAHSGGQQFAIVVFDINKFKVVNDLFGYKSGNDMLKFVSDVVAKNIHEGETFCRSAADNFNILMEYKNDEELLDRMERIETEIETYIVNYRIKISAGIYVITESFADISLLCDKANISKGIAKKQTQGNNYHFFRDENRQELLHEKEIENVMDDALRGGEFEVYLQPKYLYLSDSVVGAEALVRWNRPGHGLVPPNDFIPLFEKNGFVRKLDIYMFESVCKLLADWQRRFPEKQPVGISVNLSRVHLSRSSLPHELLTIANTHGVPPELIEIELTESAVFENVAEMQEIMRKIKDAGFMISIDDFGSGYSSLASLKYLPADFVKMDKSFLDEAENDKRGEKIICGMIDMIKSLGMGTVAEGVETRKQLDFLSSAGCDIGQGYYWAKPMSVTSFEKLVYKL